MVALLAVVMSAEIALQLANPQVMRHFIDSAIHAASTLTLVHTALLFIGIAIVYHAAGIATTYLGQSIAWTATNAMRADLVRHCLNLDMTFHNAHTPGELIERIDGDVNALGTFFSQFFLRILGSLIMLVGMLVILFLEDWRIGLAMTIFAATVLVVLNSLRDIAVPHWKASSESAANLFGFIEERIGGTEDIRANRAQPYVLRRFYELTRTWLGRQRKAAMATNLVVNSSMFSHATGRALALAVGAYLFGIDVVTIGTVYLISQYTAMMVEPIQKITNEMQNFQRCAASVSRIRELWETKNKIHDNGKLDLPAGPLSVQFDNVSFAYSDKTVLQDVSFTIKPGRVLGILGRTGSGKTTLTRLLFRFYDARSGAVLLGSRNVADVPLAALHHRIGLVTQNVQLLRASVRENLTFFNAGVPDDAVHTALDRVGLAGKVAALPMGLDTPLSAGGTGLSAGEAQLLPFARMFLTRDPGLVILDEASSRLDPMTEQLLERAVTELLKGRTAIIIAHRLNTIQRADDILIMQDGHILEHGERVRLAADPSSRFHALLATGLEEVLA